MKNSYPFLLLLLLSSCRNYTYVKEVTIDDPGQQQEITIALPSEYAQQTVYIVTNTLDDTAKMGFVKIAPRFTGTLYREDLFNDSLRYTYIPYKATTGKLVFKHSFFLPFDKAGKKK